MLIDLLTRIPVTPGPLGSCCGSEPKDLATLNQSSMQNGIEVQHGVRFALDSGNISNDTSRRPSPNKKQLQNRQQLRLSRLRLRLAGRSFLALGAFGKLAFGWAGGQLAGGTGPGFCAALTAPGAGGAGFGCSGWGGSVAGGCGFAAAGGVAGGRGFAAGCGCAPAAVACGFAGGAAGAWGLAGGTAVALDFGGGAAGACGFAGGAAVVWDLGGGTVGA